MIIEYKITSRYIIILIVYDRQNAILFFFFLFFVFNFYEWLARNIVFDVYEILYSYGLMDYIVNLW